MSNKELQDCAIELATEALRGYEFIDVAEQLDHLSDDECERVHDMITGEVKAHIPETPRIIRTPEELEALDPDTALIAPDCWMRLAGFMQGNPPLISTYLPAAVIATGDQVRAAREAMEEAARTTAKDVQGILGTDWLEGKTPEEVVREHREGKA